MNPVMTIAGNLAADPELKVTKSGLPVASFRVGCTPRVRRAGVWTDDGTIWFTVNAYRGLGENCAASLRKGDPVVVTGRLRLDSWVGADGLGREQKVIDATNVGHDLLWGRSSFDRVRRRLEDAEAEDATARVLETAGASEVEECAGR